MEQSRLEDQDAETLIPLQGAVDRNRTVLQKGAAAPASQSWLKPRLETAEGTQQVYAAMEKVVSGPGYLTKLTQAFSHKTGQQPAQMQHHGSEVLQPDFWEDGSLEAAGATSPGVADDFEKISTREVEVAKEDLESYVVVNKEDVLDAIGTFVAAYLAEVPEAANMNPAELQAAMKRAFKELQQSRLRRLWGWGRAIYRCVAFSYGAFSVYENPWLVRALLTAMWTASKMMLGLLI